MKPIKCPKCNKAFFPIGTNQNSCPFCKEPLFVMDEKSMNIFTKLFGDNWNKMFGGG